jgi:hypothetical protein
MPDKNRNLKRKAENLHAAGKKCQKLDVFFTKSGDSIKKIEEESEISVLIEDPDCIPACVVSDTLQVEVASIYSDEQHEDPPLPPTLPVEIANIASDEYEHEDPEYITPELCVCDEQVDSPYIIPNE